MEESKKDYECPVKIETRLKTTRGVCMSVWDKTLPSHTLA
jgi:hypothetical protein